MKGKCFFPNEQLENIRRLKSQDMFERNVVERLSKAFPKKLSASLQSATIKITVKAFLRVEFKLLKLSKGLRILGYIAEIILLSFLLFIVET